ncbi:MAG: hypothetical protein ACK4RK_21155 [Gemmataceae bacterium]
MMSSQQTAAVYQQLADLEERQGDRQRRDQYLVLAAEASLTAGRHDEAEHLRQRFLRDNPHHMLDQYGSMAEAVHSPDVRSYLDDLRRRCPPETAEQLLEALRARAAARAAVDDRREPAPKPAVADPPIYQFREPKGEAAAIPTQRPAPRPAPVPLAQPVAPAPFSYSYQPPAEPPTRSARVPRRHEPLPYPGGFWVASVLFLLALGTVLALLGYVLSGPWLPSTWQFPGG